MVFTRDTASLYAADGNAQNVVGPISTFSELPKISADGSTVVDAEYNRRGLRDLHIQYHQLDRLRDRPRGRPDDRPRRGRRLPKIVFSRDGYLYLISANGSPGSEKLLVSSGDTPTWGGPPGAYDGGGLPSVTVLHPAKLKLHALTHGGVTIKISASAEVAAGVVRSWAKRSASRCTLWSWSGRRRRPGLACVHGERHAPTDSPVHIVLLHHAVALGEHGAARQLA